MLPCPIKNEQKIHRAESGDELNGVDKIIFFVSNKGRFPSPSKSKSLEELFAANENAE
jgi:hypothetical protein